MFRMTVNVCKDHKGLFQCYWKCLQKIWSSMSLAIVKSEHDVSLLLFFPLVPSGEYRLEFSECRSIKLPLQKHLLESPGRRGLSEKMLGTWNHSALMLLKSVCLPCFSTRFSSTVSFQKFTTMGYNHLPQGFSQEFQRPLTKVFIYMQSASDI